MIIRFHLHIRQSSTENAVIVYGRRYLRSVRKLWKSRPLKLVHSWTPMKMDSSRWPMNTFFATMRLILHRLSISLAHVTTLAIPAYSACFSAAILAIQALFRLSFRREHSLDVHFPPRTRVIFVFNVLRAIGCAVLACISFSIDWYSSSLDIRGGISLTFVSATPLAKCSAFMSS